MATDSQRSGAAQQRVSRRAFLRAAVMTAGAGVLAACGGNTGGGQPAAGGASAPAQNNGAVLELTQWYHQYGEEGTQQAAMRYAEEYSKVRPDVKINVVWKPGDYGTALNAAMLGSDPPDIYEQSALTPDMVKSGWVVPMDDVYGDSLSDFNKAAIQSLTYDGQVYGVKMIIDTGLIYYRKSLLDQAGLQPATTLEELGAAIAALNQGQVKGIFLGNDGGVGRLEQVMWSAGHDFLKDGKPDFNNADTVAAFTMYQQLLQEHSGAILNGAPTDWWDPSSLTGGLSASQWTGLWAMPGIKKAIGDDFVITPWPQIAAGQGTPATFAGGWSQFVNSKAKNVDEAKEFARWLWIERKDLQQDWSLSYGFHVPPRASAAAEAEPLKSGPAKEAAEIVAQYGVPPSPLWTSAMGTAFSDARDNILKNGADVKAELDAAQAKVEAELG